MQHKHFTKQLFLLSFENDFKYFMLFLNKHLNRIKSFDLNTVKKEEAVKIQSNVNKNNSWTPSLAIVSWLLWQSFDHFFSDSILGLHSYFCSLQMNLKVLL